jgi:hypothetical protein
LTAIARDVNERTIKPDIAKDRYFLGFIKTPFDKEFYCKACQRIFALFFDYQIDEYFFNRIQDPKKNDDIKQLSSSRKLTAKTQNQ